MQKTRIRNSLLLLLTAAIWGTAFVAQSVGMDYVGPFTFSAVRSLIGGVVLLPVIWGLGRLRDGQDRRESTPQDRKNLIVGGVACGVMLFIASNLQQFGIQYTTVGKAGFITAFYIVLVPVMGIFIRRRCPALVWTGVALALVGLWLLCMGGDTLTIGTGDLLVFCGAIMFAVHILVIDHFSNLAEGVKLSCIQFFVCGALSAVCMFCFEQPDAAAVWAARGSILYAGVMSCGVAYTLQIVGQKGMNPTAASLILSLESVISVLAGWVLLHQKLSGRELLGCALVFVAVLFVQVIMGRQEQPAAKAGL